MGRKKLDMELITNERSRMLTFKKRKEGLMKKLHEFTTLCDVSACMIMYGPVQENRAVEPEIWPQNPDEISRIIDIHKAAKSKDSGSNIKSYGVCDFVQGRKKQVEEELTKLRKKNVEAKYPTWDEFLNFSSEAELRALATALNKKAQIVKSRIEFLKRETRIRCDEEQDGFCTSSNLSQFNTLNHDQAIKPIIDKASMKMTHNSSGNSASFKRQVFNDQATATAATGDIDMSSMNVKHNSSGNSASFKRQVINDHATAAATGDNDMASTNVKHNSSGNSALFKRQVINDQATAAAGDGVGNPMICCKCTMPLPQIYYAPPMLQPVPPPWQPYMHWPMMIFGPAQMQ